MFRQAERFIDRQGATIPVEQLNRFQRSGDYWVVSYEGQTIHMRDVAGMRYLAELLRRPGLPVPATELRSRCGRGGDHSNHVEVGGADTGGADVTGRDPARDAEQARVNITRAIHSVLRRISQHHPSLGEHLARTIRTGGSCSYSPDPRVPVGWQL